MAKLRIGRLYIKPLYVVLLTLAILLTIGGAIALINHPAVWYEYLYGFKEADLEGVRDIGFGSTLAKGEVIRGKLVIESGEVVLLITAVNIKGDPRRVVDSGIIQAGKSFHYSLRSDWTYTLYNASFTFSDDANAKLYCNLNPKISGERLEKSDVPVLKRKYHSWTLEEFIKEEESDTDPEYYEYYPDIRITVVFKPAKLR